MNRKSNKYDITKNVIKHSKNYTIVLDKLFDVLSKQGEEGKQIKETRDRLIEAMYNYEITDSMLEKEFEKLDPLILKVSHNAFDIQTSLEGFENIKKNVTNKVKLPGFGIKILKVLIGIYKKSIPKEESKNTTGIKGFGSFIENENEDWLDIIDSSFSQSFFDLYKKNIFDYLTRTNNIPTLKEMLKKTFCMATKQSIISQLQKNEFTENDYKESFGLLNEYLSERGITLEPCENIKESFIKECKKHYPLAKNSYNHLFENKSFKNEFIHKISLDLEDEIEQVFESIYWSINKTYINGDMEHYFISISILLSKILGQFQELKNPINWKSDMLSLYFIAIADKFEEDHLKKLNRKETNSSKKTEQTAKKDEGIKEIKNSLSVFTTEKKSIALNKDIEEKFDNVISILGGSEEKKESMKRYLANLYKKNLPINFSHFMKIYTIEDIPPKVENILLDKIGMEFEAEEKLKVNKTDGEEEIEKKETAYNLTEKIEIKDPVQFMINSFKEIGYQIISETNLSTQIDEYCKNDTQRKILINILNNPNFGRTLQHKEGCKEVRVLNIGRTGWRILMVNIDGNIYIDGCYNHDDYEKRLDIIKKGKAKLKTLIR